MVVGFTTTYTFSPITTEVVSSNPAQSRCTRYNIIMIRYVSDLVQVSDFHRVLRFNQTIKLTTMI